LCRCEQLPKQQVQILLATANAQVTEQDLPIILISDESDGPYCQQLHRPTIVLPRFLLAGEKEDLGNVLLHEMEHLKTNHPLQLFLQQLAQVLCWFHPTVWNAAWHASLAREFTCDDAAAAQGSNCAAYLRTLLHIAERCERNNHASAIGFSRTPSEIVLRAQRLVKLANGAENGDQRGLFGRKTATVVLLVIGCILSQLWLPSDPLASRRSIYSPWPTWTAEVLHCFGYNCRDYEQFDGRVQIHELQHRDADVCVTEPASLAQGSAGR
jgi:beta-lactamase regulating signal transducer with metallopeptidase domain